MPTKAQSSGTNNTLRIDLSQGAARHGKSVNSCLVGILKRLQCSWLAMHPEGGCLMELFSGKTHSKVVQALSEQEHKSMLVKLYASGLLKVDLLGIAPHFTDLERRRASPKWQNNAKHRMLT